MSPGGPPISGSLITVGTGKKAFVCVLGAAYDGDYDEEKRCCWDRSSILLDAEATIVAEKKHISAAAVGRSQALKTAGEQASRKKCPRQSVSTSGIVRSGMDAEEEDDDVQ